MSRRAVFLDRDGTINEDVGYPSGRPGRDLPLRLRGPAEDQGRGVRGRGRDQPIGHRTGYLTEVDLAAIHRHIDAEFAARGVRIDAFYHCPHYEFSSLPGYGGLCACRKPEPHMGRRAAADLDLDLEGSFMIGDKVEDVLFGLAIGAKPVLVRTGYGRDSERRLAGLGSPAAVADDLGEAVDWVLAVEGATP